MVELYINNKQVVMPEAFNIRLVRYNPLLNQKGDYSIPFSIPLSQNRHIINHADRVESATYQKEGSFELAVNGIVRYKGTVVFRDPKPEQDEISIYLKSNNSSFFSKIRDKNLQEYDFGEEDNSGLSNSEVMDKWEDSLNGNYADGYKYACAPVNAPYLWSQSSTKQYYYPKNINEWDHQNEVLYRSGQNWHQHMYVRWVIEKVVSNEGYMADRNDMDDFPDFNHLVIVSLNSVTGHYYNLRFSWNFPQKPLKELFDELRKLYTISPVVDEKSNKIHIVMLSKVLANGVISEDLSRSEVKHTTMKSEAPADGFVMIFESGFSDAYDYATAEATRDDAIGEVASYNDLPSPGSIYKDYLYYITSTERFWKCIEDPDNQGVYFWVEVGQLQRVTSGNEEYELKSNVEPLLQDRFEKSAYRADPDNPVTYQAEEAKTERQGNDMWDVYYSGMRYNDFPFMFGFYRGIQALDIDDPYTIAEASHDKSSSDIGSIWQDTNANQWELTGIISSSELSFVAYNHSKSMPPTGILTHVSGASQTTDINVTDTTEKNGTVNYPILSIDAYRYDNETEFSSNAISNKWITSRGLYEKIHKIINHWETERKRKVIKYLAVPNRVFFDIDMTKKYRVSDNIFLINKLEMDLTEKDFDEKIVKAELFTV